MIRPYASDNTPWELIESASRQVAMSPRLAWAAALAPLASCSLGWGRSHLPSARLEGVRAAVDSGFGPMAAHRSAAPGGACARESTVGQPRLLEMATSCGTCTGARPDWKARCPQHGGDGFGRRPSKGFTDSPAAMLTLRAPSASPPWESA